MDIIGTMIDGVRIFFFFLDGIVYKFIGIIYNLFIQIANTSIFTEEIIDLFASKVYALLGIFMLFKVSFSIMTYIVNPDEFTDKNKGFSKLITNIVITLTLLIFTPMIFSQAMDLQRIILKDNIIGKIFSTTASNSFFADNIDDNNAGSNLAYETFKAFYHINVNDFPNCEGIEVGKEESSCKSDLRLKDDDYKEYKKNLEIADFSQNINSNRNYQLLVYKAKVDKDEKYMMEYIPLVSTVVGGFMAWVLIVFCFDIAVRSVKLGFLRMIAPIPIISRIDPKGKGIFDKWTKSCISTYLDLFIRLIAIFFALFVIEQVFNMEFVSQSTGLPTNVNIFTKIFIIMGALLFAKQLPKLLQDLTGAKLDGKFTLNPMKKLGEVPFVGKAVSAGLGGLGSAITGQGFSNGWKAGGKAVPLLGGDGKQSVANGFNRFTRFGEDGKKKIEERKKFDLGEQLFAKYGSEASGNPELYKGTNATKFAQSADSVNRAKKRRDEISGEYERLKMYFESNSNKMTEVEKNDYIKKVDAARVNSLKASSDYDKLKKAHDYVRSQDAVNSRIEDAYIAAEDRHGALNKVNNYVGSPININNINNTNATINSNPQNIISNTNTGSTISGVNVSNPTPYSSETRQGVTLNPGESMTQGGIILQSGYDKTSNKKNENS